jgi:CBS domain-containing protein
MRKSAPFKSFEAADEQDKEGSKAPLLIQTPEESAPTNPEQEPVATKSKFRIANLPSMIFGTNKTETEEEKPEIVREVEERKKILGQFTMLQDVTEIPISRKILNWKHFNANYYSNDLTYEEVAGICEDHLDRMIDVRPYMIETPFVAQSTDRLQKILDIFRNMHLRSLPVINPGSGSLDGIITRQDIFAYMSL